MDRNYGVGLATDIFVLLPILISIIFAWLHFNYGNENDEEAFDQEYSKIGDIDDDGFVAEDL